MMKVHLHDNEKNHFHNLAHLYVHTIDVKLFHLNQTNFPTSMILYNFMMSYKNTFYLEIRIKMPQNCWIGPIEPLTILIPQSFSCKTQSTNEYVKIANLFVKIVDRTKNGLNLKAPIIWKLLRNFTYPKNFQFSSSCAYHMVLSSINNSKHTWDEKICFEL